MGYLTREFSSLPLQGRYPGYYEELQIVNYTCVDVVITRSDGSQETIPKWKHPTSIRNVVQFVTRNFTGVRQEVTNLGVKDNPIPAKEYTVDLANFTLYPTRVPELNLIVSTVEMSLTAKDIATADAYSPLNSEYLSDFEMRDPRLVFEVKDPYNRWECLYLSVMGQSITLRCGHMNQAIVDLDGGRIPEGERPILSCYLRYPTDSVDTCGRTIPVFEVDLGDIDKEEPYVLPTGDTICIAESIEALQRVLSKKHCGVNASASAVRINGMISKEVHDQIVNNLKSQIDEVTKLADEKRKASEIKHATTVAELNAKIVSEKTRADNLQNQVNQWSSLHDATVERFKREDALSAQREKMRSETVNNALKENDKVWDTVKIGASVIATLTSFAVTLIVKANKK